MNKRPNRDSHIASPRELAELTKLSEKHPESTQEELGQRLGLFWWRGEWRRAEK